MNHSIRRSAVAIATLSFLLPTLSFAQPRPNDHRDDRRDEHDRDGHAQPVVIPGGQPPGPIAIHPPTVDPHHDSRVDKERQDHDRDRKDPNAWNANRQKRADDHRRDLQNQYGNTVNSPAARQELATHADRMARLNRVLDVAEQKGDTAMEDRAKAAMSTEMSRFDAAMAQIKAQGGGR